MRKLLVAVTALLMASFSLQGTAQAQDTHFGAVEADPAMVDEAGEYTLTAAGSGWLPDTEILLVSCKAPGDTLVPGVATEEEITETALSIDPLAHCDIANAVPIEVDSDGNFEAELTAQVGDNFFFSAGALDGSQAGATWVPIVGDGAADAAEEVEEEEAEEEAEEVEEEEAEEVEEEEAEEEEAEEEAEEAEEVEEEEAEEEAEEVEEPLADTGVDTGALAVVGVAILAAGTMVVREARRHS